MTSTASITAKITSVESLRQPTSLPSLVLVFLIQNVFSALRASVWSKNKGTGPSPGFATARSIVHNYCLPGLLLPMNRLIKHRENIGDSSNNSDTRPTLGGCPYNFVHKFQLLFLTSFSWSPFPLYFLSLSGLSAVLSLLYHQRVKQREVKCFTTIVWKIQWRVIFISVLRTIDILHLFCNQRRIRLGFLISHAWPFGTIGNHISRFSDEARKNHQ